MEKMSHTGVYAIIIRSEQILLVEKQRGPYLNKYDLPGGTQKHGESISETLIREVWEEAGVQVNKFKLKTNLAINYSFSADKKEILLHHTGLIYNVINYEIKEKELKPMLLNEDVGHAKWVSIKEVNIDLTPIAKIIINSIQENHKNVCNQ